MSGRLVWIEDDTLQALGSAAAYYAGQGYGNTWPLSRVVADARAAPDDPVAAFAAAVRDRLGDAETTVETIALGLRALGRPYPLADARQPS